MDVVHEKYGLRMRYKPIAGNGRDAEHCPRTRIANGTTHYLLYRECVIAGEPICILEHDAEIVGKLPDPKPGVIQVSSHADHQLTREEWANCRRAQKMRQHENREPGWVEDDGVVRHPLSGTNGTSGYIISPDAAQKMIEYVHDTGVAFADRLRTQIVGDVWLQKPQSVICFHNRCRSHQHP